MNEYGDVVNTVRADLGWARDTRDSLLYPTSGSLQRVYGEVGLPGLDLEYYKASYQHQWFQTFAKHFTLMLNGEVGYAESYNDKTLPYFKNFYAGGIGSVRGYRTSSLGPRDTNDLALGGNSRVVVNAELLFPFPGLSSDKSVRLGTFVDGGMVFGR